MKLENSATGKVRALIAANASSSSSSSSSSGNDVEGKEEREQQRLERERLLLVRDANQLKRQAKTLASDVIQLERLHYRSKLDCSRQNFAFFSQQRTSRARSASSNAVLMGNQREEQLTVLLGRTRVMKDILGGTARRRMLEAFEALGVRREEAIERALSEQRSDDASYVKLSKDTATGLLAGRRIDSNMIASSKGTSGATATAHDKRSLGGRSQDAHADRPMNIVGLKGEGSGNRGDNMANNYGQFLRTPEDESRNPPVANFMLSPSVNSGS